jgi:predicted Mrr-cat superfamily restriction endonuclease
MTKLEANRPLTSNLDEIRLWCVRAEFGTYTNHFINGGYVGIGYGLTSSLASVKTREELTIKFKEAHPGVTSNLVIGQQVGQIARFLIDMKEGDYVVTPAADTESLQYGQVNNKGYWFDPKTSDGSPYAHRRGVTWQNEKLSRSAFSVQFMQLVKEMNF